ncbi:MAG: TonB-dependent receptor [candidate division Zixibacteria bacterium]|nr:TonB-dependent receptor [Candidatus Tariuqbacter arcticus]
MNSTIKHILIIIFTLLPALAMASVKITGSAADYKTGEPLPGAHLQIANTNWTTIADENGRFSFSDIPIGDYILTASHIGYIEAEQPFRVLNEATVNLNIFLRPQTIELPEVTIEAVSPSAKVYNSEVIRASTAQDLGTFLVRMGEAVILDGGGSKEARISIRGCKPEQIAVYLDGHRLNDPRTGEVNLKSIPLASLDRIVVKPNSDLAMGSSSPGGAVELYTSDAEGTALKFGTGSFGFRNYGFDTGGKYKMHRFKFSCAQTQSDGDFTYHDANGIEKTRLNDDYQNRSLFLKHSVDLGKSHFNWSFHHLETDRGAPGGIENPATLDRILKTVDGTALNLQTSGGNWISRTRASYYETSTENRTYYFFGGDTIEFPANHRSTAFEIDSRLTRDDSLGQSSVGASYRFDGVSSSSFANDEDRRDLGLYFQRSLNFDRFNLTSAVRFDSYRGYGSFISSSLSGRMQPFLLNNLSLTGNLTRGFNLPTFNQLFWAENVFAAPNPDLDPERSESYDAGVEYSQRRFRARLTYFHRDIKDMIIWQETFTQSGRKWKPVNTDAALITGIELYGGYDSVNFRFSASASISDPRNRSEDYYDKLLVFQPRVRTSESATVKIQPFNFTLSHRYLSKRYTLQANTKWVDAVSIYDVSIGYSLEYQRWTGEIILRIDNLFDEEYNIIKDSPMPGRSCSLNLTITQNYTGPQK